MWLLNSVLAPVRFEGMIFLFIRLLAFVVRCDPLGVVYILLVHYTIGNIATVYLLLGISVFVTVYEIHGIQMLR